MTELSRAKKLALIYRHTHRDYKGRIDGIKTVLVLRAGGTTLVDLNSLTDAEIAIMLPYSLKLEAERVAKREA